MGKKESDGKSGVQDAKISVPMTEEEYREFSKFRETQSSPKQEDGFVGEGELVALKEREGDVRNAVFNLGLAQERVGLTMSLLLDARRKRESYLLELGEKYGMDREEHPRWGVDLETGRIIPDVKTT